RDWPDWGRETVPAGAWGWGEKSVAGLRFEPLDVGGGLRASRPGGAAASPVLPARPLGWRPRHLGAADRRVRDRARAVDPGGAAGRGSGRRAGHDRRRSPHGFGRAAPAGGAARLDRPSSRDPLWPLRAADPAAAMQPRRS